MPALIEVNALRKRFGNIAAGTGARDVLPFAAAFAALFVANANKKRRAFRPALVNPDVSG